MSLFSGRMALLVAAGFAALFTAAGCVTAPSKGELAARVARDTGGDFELKTNAAGFELPPGITSTERLTEDDAVAVALWNNAAFQEALAGLGFNRADLLQAKQLRNPQLVTLFPAGPKQLEFTAHLPVESLWLRPRRVAAAQSDLEGAAAQLVATGLNLVRDVRVACAELELTTGRLRAANVSLRWRDEAVKLTERRLELGDASALEVAQARADALVARQALGRLERDQTLARERLRALLGAPGSVALSVTPDAFHTGSLPELPELYKQALAGRPELRANELVLEAARKRGELAPWEALLVAPMIDGNRVPGSTDIGPGLDLTLPVFHQNQGPRARAEAQVHQAVRRHVTLRDRILLDVREAVARRAQALAELAASRESVVPALESAVAQARRAYELGDVAPQLFLDAERRLAEARGVEAEALAEWRRAEAELARAMGRRLNE